MEKENKQSVPFYVSAIFLFVIGGAVAAFLALNSLHSMGDTVSDMPDELNTDVNWDREQSQLYRDIETLEDTVSRKSDNLEKMRARTRKRAKNSYYAGRDMEQALQDRSRSELMPLVREAVRNARKIDQKNQEEDDDGRDRDERAKEMLRDVLELEPGQADRVWTTMKEQSDRREKALEELANRLEKEERKPTEVELKQLEDRLNSMYENQQQQIRGSLKEEQYRRYQNWLDSGSNWWLREDENIGRRGELELSVTGSRVEVEYEERDRRRRRRERDGNDDGG